MRNKFIITRGKNTLDKLHDEESIFSLANGKVGIRGVLEEDFIIRSAYDNNSYMYGFFETEKIIYGESAYGYAKKHQTIAPVPSGHGFSVEINGEVVSLETGRIIEHYRTFDMLEGSLTRYFEWEASNGYRILIETKRIILQSQKNLEDIVYQFKVTPLNFSDYITIQSYYGVLKPAVTMNDDDPRKKNTYADTVHYQVKTENNLISYTAHATKSGKEAFVNFIERSNIETDVEQLIQGSDVLNIYRFRAKQNETYLIEAVGAYSLDVLDTSKHIDIERLLEEQEQVMKEFWESSIIEIEGNDEVNAAIIFNLYHLYQSAGRNRKVNIAAKGLSGSGYEGHYFWDTEMYMIHQLIYTQPEIAKNLLMYRYDILDKAKERALELDIHSGVLFPWRTIDGDETSAYYPAGTAQVHINADIAYAVTEYYLATGNKLFMKEAGLELLVETARFWLSFGQFINNEFQINGVTGPDEYTAMVNNNYYTNRMAKENIDNAIRYVREFSYTVVSKEELELWQKASRLMRLPYSHEKQLTQQDDSIFDKAIWNFECTPKEKYPLLLHYHPMMIYRHQVCKQADTILSHYLFFNELDKIQVQRDYDYYESITTHDSSLSKSAFSIVASLLDNRQKAYRYFMDTVYMDLDDGQGNVVDGIHVANMGGMWLSLVKGFAGFTIRKGIPTFSNHLPNEWDSLMFRLKIKNSQLEVKLTHDKIDVRLLNGEKLDIIVDDELINL